MKHKVRRIISLASVLVLGGAAMGMLAGCTTQHPEVTITYSFNGKNYSVRYKLSRNDAPKTVQHFLELSDAGFYDGMCIHDYQSDALYSGGYRFDENKELVEVNYLTTVKQLEEEKNIKFTQSVWDTNEDKTPLYSVYGEFKDNAVETQYARENRHKKGALVMYYTDKGNFNGDVYVERADGGKNNEGNATQLARYKTNSATSLFYTYTGYSSSTLDNKYCVFGMANEDDLDKLLDAIADYEASLADEEPEGEDETKSFTETIVWDSSRFNQYDYYADVRHADVTATYLTPVEKPIVIKSVKVNKY